MEPGNEAGGVEPGNEAGEWSLGMRLLPLMLGTICPWSLLVCRVCSTDTVNSHLVEIRYILLCITGGLMEHDH